MSEKPRIVVDTQLFLRAGLSPKSLIRKIIFEMKNSYQLIYSSEIRDEVRDVLTRPKLRIKFPQLTAEVTAEILEILDAGEVITLPDPIPAVVRDPKDDIFVACAVAGKAAYLVSEDNDLLDLKSHGEVRIVDVPTFFEIIKPRYNNMS